MSQCTDKAEKFNSLKREIEILKKDSIQISQKAKTSSNVGELMVLVKKVFGLYEKIEDLNDFFDKEGFISEMRDFLPETFKWWSYKKEKIENAKPNIEKPIVLPTEEYLKKLKELRETNIDDSKGESKEPNIGTIVQCKDTSSYTIEQIKQKIRVINPLEDEKLKPFFQIFREKNNREPYLQEVFVEIHRVYPNLIMGDLRTFQTIQEYSEASPQNKEEIKTLLNPKIAWDQSMYPGSAFVGETGLWCCPDSGWSVGSFRRNGTSLGCHWVLRYQVVLLAR